MPINQAQLNQMSRGSEINSEGFGMMNLGGMGGQAIVGDPGLLQYGKQRITNQALAMFGEPGPPPSMNGMNGMITTQVVV